MDNRKPETSGGRKSLRGRILVLTAALLLLVCAAVTGTLAWLTAETAPVQNTFTVGNIDIELTETTSDYKMVPGLTIDKDPAVRVKSGSEDCYLFVQVAESADLGSYINYAIDSAWTKLVDGVYYIAIDTAAEKNISYPILGAGSATYNNVAYSWNQDQVLVKPTVTAEMMSRITTGNQPTLSFTAYAVQLYKNNTTQFTPAEAWSLAKTLPPVTP